MHLDDGVLVGCAGAGKCAGDVEGDPRPVGGKRQAEALAIAALQCKSRFPEVGGMMIWMGHDSFACTANTSIVDY